MANADKTVIVTGGNSGLGFETARAILREGNGWHVVIAGRSPHRCEEAASRLSQETGAPPVEVMVLNLASLAAVRKFASRKRPRSGNKALNSWGSDTRRSPHVLQGLCRRKR